MNKLLEGLKDRTNIGYTEKGAIKRVSTGSALYNMFAMGGAMRNRSDADIILMFREAYKENPRYAMKCLFYMRDIRGGQGERRFFRVILKDLAVNYTSKIVRNISLIPEYGRWDDLYALVGTPLEKEAFSMIKRQLKLDINSTTPSLLAKWLKSENTSSKESRALATLTRKHLNMSSKEYRVTLSQLRKRIGVLERLMSEGRWDEIEFDKIPSKAGLIYRNAFARHDLERMKSEKKVQSYADFARDSKTTVNAKTLYPYECVEKALDYDAISRYHRNENDAQIERLMINKYWDNLANYFNDAELNALAVVDTSGSMIGTPMDVAISLGLYCADKAKGPFAGHYISFSSRPQLVETRGIDFVDKVVRIKKTNLCSNTNIEATFDLILDTAVRNGLHQEDLPENLIIISDMEFDMARAEYYRNFDALPEINTLMESICEKWKRWGYEMPHLIFWNVDARNDNIPMKDKGNITYVSGMSPIIFEQVMSGKTGVELMMDKLNSDRYAAIR